MGIYDREYYRDDAGGWGGWGSRGATPWLVGVTVAAWLLQLFTRNAIAGGINALGAYDDTRILQGEVWRLLTPMFLHNDRALLQVVFNMLILYWIGTALEERYGSREFLVFYLLAGLISHLAFFLVQLAGLAPPVLLPLVGSNSAVNAAFVLYAFHNPRATVLLFFVLPVPIWLVAAGYVVFSTLGTIAGVGAAFVSLAGALFGVVYYYADIRLSAILPSGRLGGGRSRSQPRLRVVPPDSDDNSDTDEPPPPQPTEERFDERVDRLLEKVSRHGQESLTPEERELLFRAGEHYKKRRR
jgi:membrane associated rhomboid family serine protease